MSIDKAVAALIEAIEANTAAVNAMMEWMVANNPNAVAAPAPAPAPARAPAPAATKVKAKKAPEITLDDLRQLGLDIAKNKKIVDSREKVVCAIQRKGADRIGDVLPEHYADLKVEFERILNEPDYDPRDGSGGDEEEDLGI